MTSGPPLVSDRRRGGGESGLAVLLGQLGWLGCSAQEAVRRAGLLAAAARACCLLGLLLGGAGRLGRQVQAGVGLKGDKG
jgi:hypothetical protein